MIDDRRMRFRMPLIAVAAVAVAVVVAAFIIDVRELAAAFLVAYTGLVSVALGMLALALIAQLSTATWFAAFRPIADAVTACLPALAAIGIVLLLAAPVLYPWTGHETARHAYLNGPFFVARWVVYWTSWIAIAESLRSAWRMGDRGAIADAHRRARRTASAGLIVLAFTMTFAAFDWMMSLEPDWQSSIYGVYWFAGGVLSALGLLAVMANWRGPMRSDPLPGPDDVHSLAKLMMTFVLFWLYIGFAQYIVIWSGDLPKEVTWYASRTHDGWGVVAGVLLFGSFVFPFLLLLLEPVRRNSPALAMIGGVLLLFHFVDTFWLVMPGLVAVRWWTVIVEAAVVALNLCATSLLLALRQRGSAAHMLPAVRLRVK